MPRHSTNGRPKALSIARCNAEQGIFHKRKCGLKRSKSICYLLTKNVFLPLLEILTWAVLPLHPWHEGPHRLCLAKQGLSLRCFRSVDVPGRSMWKFFTLLTKSVLFATCCLTGVGRGGDRRGAITVMPNKNDLEG